MTPSRTDGGTPVADGGRRTPGVPDVSGESEERATGTTSSPSGAAESEGSSGRAMPGVPETRGAEPSEETGGGTCGTEETPDQEPEHDLTTAFSLEALKRTSAPASVVAEANTWSDWVGVVGEASGPELNAYFRNNTIDVDFFNDVSNGPAERLASIDEDHHFYADRRVLIGLPEERAWAEEAGWEFQPLAAVAEESGWRLAEE
ncbi:MAG: hypothetical protein ABEJ77_05605 [Halanaeroarchaeum sp.]